MNLQCNKSRRRSNIKFRDPDLTRATLSTFYMKHSCFIMVDEKNEKFTRQG